jgi:hypothetical protein
MLHFHHALCSLRAIKTRGKASTLLTQSISFLVILILRVGLQWSGVCNISLMMCRLYAT